MPPALVAALANALLAGEQTVEGACDRATHLLGRDWRWLPPLTRRYIQAFRGQTRPRQRDVVRFLLEDTHFARARSRHGSRIAVRNWLGETHRMQPVAAARDWPLPAIESAGDLCAWLDLTPAELDWFADLKALTIGPTAKLGHYHYRVKLKGSGGIRLIEAPKRRLKQLQRRILTGILDHIPGASRRPRLL